ncbi:hydroxysqualene dehydroxylase [Paenibacillus aestuarii]|uniref:FAD-dependent oxidoreductase n=1 Tax=Paenibacillus aestuarii TaxID=516965 RepID=A0ABW0KAI0_9BACL|nr:FAD-dependent oxidoreductase [Paenibacillus aestuarii]
MMKKVAILGGGVAGLSAAHELIERGYQVTVYEYKNIPGGKARSMPFAGSGKDGRRDLPGEHGFRLFPRFYRHVIDTLKRIPYGEGTVYDNLEEVTRLDLATYTAPLLPLLAKIQFTLADFKVVLKDLFDSRLGLSMADMEQYADKLWQVMTSCEQRIQEEYNLIDWWTFIQAQEQSEAFQKIFAGFTKTLVACQSKVANTMTVGPVAVQMTLDITTPGTSFVRLLNGPTNDRWIYPWLTYLQDKGLEYRLTAKVESIDCEDGVIRSATISENGHTYQAEADYFIAAFPVEVMAGFVSEPMIQADPSLEGIVKLKDCVAWMNGIQYYLKEDVTMTHGHVIYLDAPWSLTSVSQKQFWPGVNLSDYGDGEVKGILSVDISDWESPGILYGKPAMECTAEEIKEEVWAQMKKSLNVDGEVILEDDVLHSWFLDPDIHFENPHSVVNMEPLLINKVGTWELRPEAYTAIPNLFLASDYVRTNTNLATMEGANEAARRAVNAILQKDGFSANDMCEIWEMYKFDLAGFDVLSPWRKHDQHRYDKGLPWDGKLL